MIDTLSANMDETSQQPDSDPELTGEELMRHRRLTSLIQVIKKDTMIALRDIFSQRAWWSRIWVIQEVISAGEAVIIWYLLMHPNSQITSIIILTWIQRKEIFLLGVVGKAA